MVPDGTQAPRNLPDPGFAGDTGEVSDAVAEALSRYAEAPETEHRRTLAVLQHSRVLVPVVAVLGEVEYDDAGLARDKTSDMAAVLMRGRDGRLALLAFTGTAAMQRWDPAARPVPVTLRQAARSALHDGAAALVVDVAGPVQLVVEERDLRALSEGYTLAEVEGTIAWVRTAGGEPDR